MSEQAQVVDVIEIEKESNALISKVDSYQITTNDIYVEAMEFAKTIKVMQKEVDAAFDPIIKNNHGAWKAAIAQKAKYYEPLEKALKFLDSKGRTFRQEQEALRFAEQQRLEGISRKEAERLQKLADKAKARGDEGKADLYANKAQETASITPVVAPKFDKIEGITVRKIWKFRIVDEKLLHRDWLMPDLTKIGATVRATRGTLLIPGLEIYSEDSSI